MAISIVRRVEAEVAAGERRRVLASEFERVNHGGIALHGEPDFQAIQKNARDDGALFGLRSFGFDERGQRDDLFWRERGRGFVPALAGSAATREFHSVRK